MQNLWQLPWYSAHLQRDGWRWIGSIGLALAVGVGYLLTALVSLALLTKPDEVAVFWPAAGIAAGTLIALGPKARLPVTLAVLTASAAASLLSGRNLPAAIVFALCNAGEALFVAWLIKQRFGKDFRLNSLRSVLGFFAAAGVGPAISGAVATAGFVLFYSSGAPLLTTWLNWLASDALGIIMVAPLLIGLAGLRRDLPERWELTEGTLTLAALAAVGAIAFGSPAHNWWCTVLPLGLLLPALLAAHCRPVFAAAAALILGFAVVWTTTFGIGELGELSSLPDRAYAARTTLLAISTYTLVLAALFAERRHQEAALADSNNRLKASNDRLQLALSGAELGVWSLDTKTGHFESDARDGQIHAYPPDAPPKTLAAARPFIHADDLPTLDAAFADSERAGGSCKVEYRLAASNAGADPRQERWVALEATVVRDADGRPAQLLGVTRDITQRKRAEKALAERNLQLALAGKFALVGTFAFDIGSGRLQVSPGYAVMHGLPEETEETSRAGWRTRVHPDDLSDVEAGFHQALAERRHEHYCEYRIVRSGGEVRWIDSRSFIFYDRNGTTPRLVGANIDVTQRKLTKAALAENQASLADALVAGQVMAFEWDALTRQSRRSDNAALILGDDEGGVTGSPRNEFLGRIHADDRQTFRSRMRELCPGNPSYVLSFRFCCRDGRQVWLEEAAKGEFDATGRLLRIKGLTRDITERKRAELALEERNVQLALAGKAARVGSYAYSLDADVMQVSEGYAALHGLPEGTAETTRSEWRARTHPEDLVRVEELHTRAIRERLSEYEIEYRIFRSEGEIRWIESRSFISYAPDGSPRRVVGVNIDVTERRRAEDQQRVLVAELDHRVKNVLATVSAIVTQTQDAGSSLVDFVAALDRRIKSLARTHELLSQSRWSGVSLAEIARREFAPYAADNVEIGGPSVTLKAEAAQAMAMVLHELTTNAAKYGAFSDRNGRVLLRWRLLANGSHGRLAVEWQEIGGPPVLAPSQSGYGTAIIRELIPFELGGTVELAFADDGVRCRMEIPAEWVSRSRPPGKEFKGLTSAQAFPRD
jgi:PAS domain S-box-containing protein